MTEVLSLFSRRGMLVGLAGGAAATAGVVATNGFTDSASLANLLGLGPSGGPLQNGGYKVWKAQVGSAFRAHSGHELKLVDVQSFPKNGARPGNVRDRAFVARFDVSKGGALPADLYRVVHRDSGMFDMFLTKGSPDQPLRMLAVFA